MWDSVSDNWVRFNEPLEGVLSFMYLDARFLVTTGMGNLIDSHESAAQLAWMNGDGPASSEEIAAEWDNVKARTDLAPHGGGSYAPPVTSLYIEPEEIDRIVTTKLAQNEATLTNRAEFSDFPSWPADAQFGLLSMAWALGPAFRFPNFQRAAANGDWETAAAECVFGPHVGTIEKRNAMDQECFHNATQVVEQGLDPSVLLIAG
jgi:GH24 family phage-related lysozyme (muramidase)